MPPGTVDLHATVQPGFGQRLASRVAAGLAQFCDGLDKPVNGIWTALRDGEIVGSVAMDGHDLGENIVHLRWFIVDDSVRGSGAGLCRPTGIRGNPSQRL